MSQTEFVLNVSHTHTHIVVNIMQFGEFRPKTNVNCNEGGKRKVCVHYRNVLACYFDCKYMSSIEL
jgi:hypothetical protein